MRVDILGFTFHIQSDEDPDYLAEVVESLKKKTQETRNRYPGIEPTKCLIMTGIQLVDELLKERKRISLGLTSAEAEEAFRITEDIIRRIDDSLPGGK
jgi:cell division protein ZapA (FtsZ GTPase activity inhibitor)